MLSKNTIKHLTSLHHKKYRHTYNEFVVEGEKIVAEAIEWAKDAVIKVYCLEQLANEFISNGIAIEIITERELKQISSLSTPNKAIAVMRQITDEIKSTHFYLALDGIQDPGNLGTIIRLADWFGIHQIICSNDCVDCYNSKVVQASMGSIFRIQMHYVELADFLTKSDLPIYGALLNGANIYKQPLQRKGILVMGNEGNGIRPELLPLVTQALTIPKFGEAESLNVGIATAILLSEFSRS
jgi:RNA methyltransferase, TrmH family